MPAFDDDKTSRREVSTGRHYVEDTQTERLSVLEPIWARLRRDAEIAVKSEPRLAAFLTANVLRFHSFDHAASEHLGELLGEPTHGAKQAKDLIAEALNRSLALCTEVADDFEAAITERAAPSWSILLQDPGYHGLVVHRVASWLLHTEQKTMAEYFAGRARQLFGVEIELGAQLDGGLVVGAGVSISWGSRIGQGVVLGHGVVIRDATVGRRARVLPNSVVTSTVQPESVVAGVPAQPIER